MNDSNKIKTSKKKLTQVKMEDDKLKYDIEITDEHADFGDKLEDGKETTVKGKIKKFEKNSDGKYEAKGSEETGKEIKVVYKKGTFSDKLELKSIDDKNVKDKKTFGGSFKWPFWTLIVVGFIVVVSLIVWWVMASRKEDKEEGDL